VANGTRQEFQALLNGKRKAEVGDRRTDLRILAQATVPINVITHSTEWDFFLSILQAKIESIDASAKGITDAFTSSPSFDAAEMAKYKANLLRLAVSKATLESVMKLPAQILSDGERAQLELFKFDED